MACPSQTKQPLHLTPFILKEPVVSSKPDDQTCLTVRFMQTLAIINVEGQRYSSSFIKGTSHSQPNDVVGHVS